MTKKIRLVHPPTPAPRKSDDEFSFSQDALNLVTRSLPAGYSILDVEQPDTYLATEEDIELLRKAVPKILGTGEMAAVFNLITFDNESVSTTATILKKRTGTKYSLKTVRRLYDQARAQIRVFYDRVKKEVRDEERKEKAKKRHGNIH